MKSQLSPKERGLIKGCIRRVFSRSDIRRQVIESSVVPGYTDLSRKRVKTWCKCSECEEMIPKSYMEVDHKDPVIPLDRSLEEMSLDELVDRTWCGIENLSAICETCHDVKTKAENKERRQNKKNKKALDTSKL